MIRSGETYQVSRTCGDLSSDSIFEPEPPGFEETLEGVIKSMHPTTRL
jgi:hypothetical protein